MEMEFRQKKQDAIFLALLQGHISSICRNAEEIDTYTLASLDLMYKQYKELGGNGVVDRMMEQVKNLSKLIGKEGKNG